MTSKHAVAAMFLVPMMVGSVLAQETTPTSEFGRVSGGQVELLTKGTSKVSGSLGASLSASEFGRTGYEGTLGGTILQDRLWFFASASSMPQTQLPMQMQQGGVANAVDAKVIAQLGDRSNFTAAFSQYQSSIPSSFLSLRYTGMPSNNLLFNASFMRRTISTPSPW